MKMNKSDDQMLDDLFALGRSQTPTPSDALMARVIQDAQIAFVPDVQTPRSNWTGLFDFIGGWPSIGGLAVAGVTGVWFGVAPPASVSILTTELIGTSVSYDLLDDTSTYFAETLIDG